MTRFVFVFSLLLTLPSLCFGQLCVPDNQSVSWVQPKALPIDSDYAVRWPTDATIRVGYVGPWCPTPDQVELFDTDGNLVPAQVRFRSPFKLVNNAPDQPTIMEIDPDEELAPRTDYSLVVHPPTPASPLYRDYTINFRTWRGPRDDEYDDFEGITSVSLSGDHCEEGGSFHPLYDANPNCPVPNRLLLAIEFTPLDRGDLTYIVYRTSTSPLATPDNPRPGGRDETPIPIAYEAGVKDVRGTGVPLRKSQIFVPYYPLPRQDCFSVRVIDEYGRERGDTSIESCVELQFLEACANGRPIPEPNPFEEGPALPGQACGNQGLNGGDSTREIPPLGGAGGEDGMGGENGGAGGAGGEGSAPVNSTDDGGCRINLSSGTNGSFGLAFILCLALLHRRRKD